MIHGISYWSVEGGLQNRRPIAEALGDAKAAGFSAMELAIGDQGVLSTQTPREACEAIRKQIDESGLVVETLASGMSWGANPVSNDPVVRERAVSLHSAALERAAWLGCKATLFVPGVVTSPISPDERVRYDHAIERCRENVKRLLDVAERVGVDLCLENVWNGMFLSPLELRDFIDSFGSARLGVYFDVGNLLGYHQYPPHWIELLGGRIKRVHIKDFRDQFGWEGTYSFCGLGEGDVPWAQTVEALKKGGYASTIIAEMLPHRPGLLEETRAAMDRIFGHATAGASTGA